MGWKGKCSRQVHQNIHSKCSNIQICTSNISQMGQMGWQQIFSDKFPKQIHLKCSNIQIFNSNISQMGWKEMFQQRNVPTNSPKKCSNIQIFTSNISLLASGPGKSSLPSLKTQNQDLQIYQIFLHKTCSYLLGDWLEGKIKLEKASSDGHRVVDVLLVVLHLREYHRSESEGRIFI